jgi:hypothetical protein
VVLILAIFFCLADDAASFGLRPQPYEDFLQDAQRPEPVLIEEFADEGVRRDKLARAAGYGELIYELLAAVVPDDRMRYLVV